MTIYLTKPTKICVGFDQVLILSYHIISKLSSLIHSSTASLMIKFIASNPRMRLHEKWALNIVTHPQLPMLKF